jgi:hypothetical protein
MQRRGIYGNRFGAGLLWVGCWLFMDVATLGVLGPLTTFWSLCVRSVRRGLWATLGRLDGDVRAVEERGRLRDANPIV